jgi:MoaA/NifB/PqqE/SkfB family radical SAM enzyme
MRILPILQYIPTLKGLWNNFIKKEAIYPFYASFKITSRCHFGCPFCNMKKNTTPDLSTEGIKLVLDNLSRSSVLMTSFEGGEPLLREDIGELLQYARRCKFYLLFTCSAHNIFDYSIEEYSQYIDFLHISIDEGHDNLDMFKLLPDLVKLPTQISVQTVVTNDTIKTLESKVKQCYENGVTIVIIPAAPMTGAKHCFPDIKELEKEMNYLYTKYPNTIHTPQGYFKAYRNHKCSSASVIIAPDGQLYYPCHILETKGPDLGAVDLNSWLTSKEAHNFRMEMKKCSINCGWYQYYTIDSYTSFWSMLKSLKPTLFQKKHRK